MNRPEGSFWKDSYLDFLSKDIRNFYHLFFILVFFFIHFMFVYLSLNFWVCLKYFKLNSILFKNKTNFILFIFNFFNLIYDNKILLIDVGNQWLREELKHGKICKGTPLLSMVNKRKQNNTIQTKWNTNNICLITDCVSYRISLWIIFSSFFIILFLFLLYLSLRYQIDLIISYNKTPQVYIYHS